MAGFKDKMEDFKNNDRRKEVLTGIVGGSYKKINEMCARCRHRDVSPGEEFIFNMSIGCKLINQSVDPTCVCSLFDHF